MALIAHDIINQVIGHSDIVDLIGNYTALKKAGRNFKGLCPFHHEKTPSFVVNPDKQIFHCFGCGVGGDVLGFLMRLERLDFPEAVRFLAHKAGIVIPEDADTLPSPSRQQRDDILKINALSVDFFHQTLLTAHAPEVQAARDYLKKRGLEIEAVKNFQLGYALNEWDALLKYLGSKGVSTALMVQAGLVIAREGKTGFYDRFRHRLMFPIFDVQGRCVAFGGRALQDADGAKYINSPETPVYTKGQHLFGLQLAKTAIGQLDRILVVEGYMDMIMPTMHGVEGIVASLGTALTVEQVRLMRRFTHNVVMLFDADAAGQAAMVRSLDLLIDEKMQVRVAVLEGDEDPDSYIRRHGRAAFEACIDNAYALLDFKFKWLASEHDVFTVEGKSKISEELLKTIARFKSEVTKYELIKALAKKLNVPETVLIKEFGGKKALAEAVALPEPVVKTPAVVAVEELLLALFLKDSAWVVLAQEQIKPDDFKDQRLRVIVDEIWQLSADQRVWSSSDLLGRLSDPALQGVVTGLINIEEGKLKDPAQVFKDCVGKMHKEKQKKVRSRLLEAIRQAEALQDVARLDTLKEEFNQLLKASV